MKKVFIYGGHKFIPLRTMSREDIQSMPKSLIAKADLRLWDEEYSLLPDYGEPDYVYDYDNFYKAAHSRCDIFKCIDDKSLYIPGEHELFRFVREE